jgi:hypothetical protein
LLKQCSRREVDAIVCHELSHLLPVGRVASAVLYVAVAAAVMAAQLSFSVAALIPLGLPVAWLLVKAWRRSEEYKADRQAVQWSCDPEALITGLARAAHATGLPMEWGAPTAWMLAHPSTTDRFQAIARIGGLQDSRVAELVAASTLTPDSSYSETVQSAASQTPFNSRLLTQLFWYSLLSPVVLGFGAAWILQQTGLGAAIAIALGVPLSMLALYLGYEWIVGQTRAMARDRAVEREGTGIFAGLSPASEPRIFDGMYHFDCGMVQFQEGQLRFAGDRVHFLLDRRLVDRVWLGRGPRHWAPRHVVYIECRPSPDTEPVTFSLQSFDARIWPFTWIAARSLHAHVETWRSAASANAQLPLPCALPQVQGEPEPVFGLWGMLKTTFLYAGVGSFLSTLMGSVSPAMKIEDLVSFFYPPLFCGALAIFVVWPRLRWR